ncbi:hypothetical protein CWE13_03285 [Aliidiomarina shirensis]|uniref:Type II secretion system protein GspF domain-containing protein n=1 Tax=Aliidiomarina shirensis TaxID=1048642 RepID=A0A432WY32_9GAMM|nr:type II secretion system F family protein [Aliidiomarina shirensis]RUO38682.1 hypothetical protein CWE13_03285 [Aliidiomarina shirensis]
MNEPTLLIAIFALGFGTCVALILRARGMFSAKADQYSSSVSNALRKIWLLRSKQAYRQQARYALPAFMETLAMLLSAGYPLQSALQRIVSTANGVGNPLMLEMRELLRRTRTGETLSESLKKLKLALPGPEMAMFVSLLVQANQHGGRLADLLNYQAEVRRQQVAEEIETRAQEAPVRLLLPLVVFVFPATMLPFIGVIIGKLMWPT